VPVPDAGTGATEDRPRRPPPAHRRGRVCRSRTFRRGRIRDGAGDARSGQAAPRRL